jgi:hypothetical protein
MAGLDPAMTTKPTILGGGTGVSDTDKMDKDAAEGGTATQSALPPHDPRVSDESIREAAMIREPVLSDPIVLAEGVDEEAVEPNRRLYAGWALALIGFISVVYASFHMIALNGISISGITGIELPFLPQLPLETWNFRIVHIAGALGLGFLLFAAYPFNSANHGKRTPAISIAALLLLIPALISLVTALDFARTVASGTLPEMGGLPTWASFEGTPLYDREVIWFGVPLLIASLGGIALSWVERRGREHFAASDLVLALSGIVAAIYLLAIYGTAARNSVGTPFVPIGVAFAATAGAALILELTRRVAGLALVAITFIFLIYTFTAHLLPGILAVQNAYTWQRFFGHVYSDAGILGPTTAVSSTYIILFIIFAAFLQASKVGDYFVNFAFAAAGRTRGGPAKVAIFASGLMGMINGTSAGNVVATGSLTIPLMKKIGYPPKSAGAIEAGASTGGQIMPPIMGAGAFIMAEITGIPYTEIAVAAIIPAVLYFGSIFFMVDFEARKLGMRGMREDELPKFRELAKHVYLFLPDHHPDRGAVHGLLCDPGRHAGNRCCSRGLLVVAQQDDAARHLSGLQSGRYDVDPDHRRVCLCRHHCRCHFADRRGRAVLFAAPRFGRYQSALGAVLRHVHFHPAWHGHADHGGLCGGGIGGGTRPHSAWHQPADRPLLRVLLRGGLGDHAARCAGQLRGGGDIGRQSDGHIGDLVQDRTGGVHRAVHVLLQPGAFGRRNMA